MTALIRFSTTRFDVATERPNPINPIPGESLLHWLRDRLPDVRMTPPEAEDWGWYSLIDWQGRQYLIGACAYDPEEDGSREWTLQIEKQRSLGEKLLGREKMTEDDNCVARLLQLLESEPAFSGVARE